MESGGNNHRILRRAYALACFLGHSAVGTEHLLIGSVMESHPAWVRQGLTPTELLHRLVALRGRGSPISALPSAMTRRAEQVLDGQTPIPEALLRLQEGGACQLLRQCGADRDLLFTDLIHRDCVGKENTMQMTRLLDQFGIDMTRCVDPERVVIGRQREIETVLQILCRKHKNNPALIGEPGVGKTAVVEGVAQCIAMGHVPQQLQGKRLISLDMASVLAGTKYRGEFEERMRDIIHELRRVGNVILFVDEMHTLVGAGAAEGAIDAANLLKPALGRGEIQMIGATTLTEYRKYIEKDAALERRFRCVQIQEPSPRETEQILRGLRAGLEAHHGIGITEEAILAAVELSCRYFSDKFLPDKALDLLDEGAACAKLHSRDGRGSDRELLQAVQAGDFDRAALLRQELRKTAPLRGGVHAGDIATAVADRTGIPVGSISLSEKQRLRELEATLSSRVVGQERAIRAVCEAVRRGRSGLAGEKRPVASMLFLGPTGVGKTELCKTLAEAVYGSEGAMIRVDMSEYMEKHSVSRLIGAPPGYVGHEEGGDFCERVRRKPYSLILLDEIEKAHPEICGILLQVMDDGILTDSAGRKIDFRNCLLVMTSNLGSKQQNRGALGFGATQEDRQMQALREHFPPEFLGRIDCLACFQSLGQEELRQIAALQLRDLQRRGEKQGLSLSIDPELSRELARRALRSEKGARELRRLIQTELEAPLAHCLLSEPAPTRICIAVQNAEICLREGGL